MTNITPISMINTHPIVVIKIVEKPKPPNPPHKVEKPTKSTQLDLHARLLTS
jgi:hypothetical protein